jgi:putative cell wall-binding protein
MKKLISFLLVCLVVLVPVLSPAAQDPASDATMVKKSHSPKLKSVRVKQRGANSRKSRVKSKDMTPVPQENVTDQVEVSQQADKLNAKSK